MDRSLAGNKVFAGEALLAMLSSPNRRLRQIPLKIKNKVRRGARARGQGKAREQGRGQGKARAWAGEEVRAKDEVSAGVRAGAVAAKGGVVSAELRFGLETGDQPEKL